MQGQLALPWVLALAAGLAPTEARGIEVAATGGRIEVREAGRLLADFGAKAPAAERAGPPTGRTLDVASHTVIEVRVPLAHQREEVWIAERDRQRTSPILHELVGAKDVDGETSLVVSVSERAIARHQTAVRLRHCDGAPVPVFFEVWDFGARRFRPRAPDLPPAGGPALEARRGDPGMPKGRLVGGIFWTGASTTASADDARSLGAPAALNDGDPSTFWAEGAPGDGRGETLIARGSAEAAIVGLRILPGDASSESAFRASGKPRKLTVFLGPERRFEVTLAEDPDGGVGRFRQPFWVAFPQAVNAACVAVALREVSPGRSGATAVAELDVMTTLDGPDAVERLVEQITSGEGCRARVPVLLRLGEKAVAPVAAAVAQSVGGKRECLLEALVGLIEVAAASDRPALAEALTSALLGARPEEEKLVLEALPRLSSPPTEALARLLADEARPDEDRARAARALAVIDRDEARRALVAIAGRGSALLRAAVRERLAALPAPAAGLVRTAAREASAEVSRQADLLFGVGPLAAREPEERAETVRFLRLAYEQAQAFEVQARAIEALGRTKDEEAFAALAQIRARSPDAVLRYLATRELATAPREHGNGALRDALADADPRVRETAVMGLARQRDHQATGLVAAAAKQEPWPFVRRAEIVALGALCGAGAGDLMIRAIERDVEEVRQAALASLVRCRDRRARSVLLQVLAHRAENPELRIAAARQLAALGDRSAAEPLARTLERLREEPHGDLALEALTVVTVQTLAALGGPAATTGALALLGDERAALKKAALNALGQLCDPRAAAAVRAATADRDESIAASAVAAERRCRRVR